MTIMTPFLGIFHANVGGSYQLTYDDAKRLCEINGAALATYNQLYAAWQAGFETCSYVDFKFVTFHNILSINLATSRARPSDYLTA